MGKLAGRIAVITGGSSGIGLAIAKLFVEEGAYVFITGRRQHELDVAKAAIGRNVTAVQGDISDLNDLDRLYNIVAAEKGVVHIVVANAAIVQPVPTDKVTPQHFDQTFNVNCRGTYFTVQQALPLMTEGGSIVLVGSAAHLKGIPVYSTYAATKAAIRSFSRTWANELKDRRIRVNTLSPGPVDTPIIDAQYRTKAEADQARELFVKMTPLGRFGRSEEIASAALFLASDDSSFSTGIDLVVDGGITQL